MKKSSSFSLVFAIVALILISIAIFTLQIAIFRTPRDTGFYFFQDMAFLPLQVALVSIVLGKYLKEREKRRDSARRICLSAHFSARRETS